MKPEIQMSLIQMGLNKQLTSKLKMNWNHFESVISIWSPGMINWNVQVVYLFNWRIRRNLAGYKKRAIFKRITRLNFLIVNEFSEYSNYSQESELGLYLNHFGYIFLLLNLVLCQKYLNGKRWVALFARFSFLVCKLKSMHMSLAGLLQYFDKFSFEGYMGSMASGLFLNLR